MKNSSTNYLVEQWAYQLDRAGRWLLLFVFLGATLPVLAQDRSISGTVTSEESGEALPGVNVIVKGTTIGTVTNIEGEYRLSVPNAESVIEFSFIGFASQEVTVGNQGTINIELASDIQALQEVVVVGYGTQSERFNTQQVAKVSGADFENQPVVNVQEVLQGRAAGVQVANTSGVLGAQSAVRIRGASSIGAGNQPLYVVDGVPLNDGQYSNTFGAESLNPLQNLNPNEIESISVLKDASAVAIYGSRGANGVILITTKQGSFGEQTNINVDVYTGWSEPTNYFDMMNADQYRQFRTDYRAAQGQDPIDFPDGGFDWANAVLQTGRVNQATVSASGGSEKTTFYLGATYYNEEAFTIGNEIDRLNGRLNLKHEATDKLRVGANLGLSALDNDRINSDNSTFAPLTSAYLQTPYIQPFNDDGTFTNTGFVANVLAIEALSKRELISRRTTGNMYAEYDLLPDLTLKTDFGTDMIQTEETIRDPDIVEPGGYGYKRIIQDNKWLNTTTLDYDRQLNEQHYIGVLLGASYETSTINRIAVEGSGFVSDLLPNVANAATPTTTSAEEGQWALSSQYARLNYRFQDRYLLEGAVRRDGSSRFGSENRYGVFWAVSGGWILSDEAFLQNSTVIDNLKLSVSYGTSGNDRIGELNPFNVRYYPSLGLYEGGPLGDYGGTPGIIPSQPANPNLQWEETTQLDISVNASMFDSRLGIEASYYIKQTDNLLLEVPLPFTTGFQTINQNTGELENRGVDLLINGEIVRGQNFNWSASLNLGYLQNEVTSLPDDNQDPQGRNFVPGTASQRVIQGEPINTFYLIRYNGINPQTGNAEWLTADGEVTTSPSAADRVIVGSAIPNWTGGLNNTLSYKGLTLDVLFNFVAGNKIFRGGQRFTDNPASSFNKSTALLNYWQNPGDDAYFPALDSETAPAFAQRSTAQLEDGDFIRLRRATLAYNFPTLLQNSNVFRSARVYVSGQNLLTFARTDLEPELNGGGTDPLNQGEGFFTPPLARTITVGVSLGF
ncbi:MAG: SusC/RagA family TonB-linked outer membrane protein [Cyclobacteriaceae bacterium]